MEYYNNQACITFKESGLCKIEYDNLKRAKKIKVVRTGGYGREALIAYDSLPDETKLIIQKKVGGCVKEKALQSPLLKFYEVDIKAKDFFSTYKYENGNYVKEDKQRQYTANASALNAVIGLFQANKTLRKSLGGTAKIGTIYKNFILPSLQAFRVGWGHTLPRSERQLRDVINKYQRLGYEGLISGKDYNDNAKKVIATDQHALLRRLCSHANNFDMAQIARIYNDVAALQGWKKITRRGLEKTIKENAILTEGGRRGEVSFDNKMAMHVKRRGPGYPMLFWTIDGWDVELLYQKTEVTKEGRSLTTFHNRPTVVIVLDPFTKYPIGYAVGTHENTALIKQAVRNALTHTQELFGCRYRPQQLQSDRYGKGALTPFFEAITPRYTPARAHNAKAKPIEPYFNYLNKTYFQFCNNWSGFGVTANVDNQPNAEYRNKIRHSFPDFNGAVNQVIDAIEKDRAGKIEKYKDGFLNLATDYQLPWTTEQYLFHAGEIKQRTSKIRGGLDFDIKGNPYSFDTFDPAFRDNIYTDWQVCYDPANMQHVLAVANDGAQRFLLTNKHIQPMALVERQEGDAEALALINKYNKDLKQKSIDVAAKDFDEVSNMLEGMPNDTLAKMLLVDSMGQHKDRRNEHRAIAEGRKMIAQQEAIAGNENIQADDTTKKEYEQFLDQKNNYDEYL